MHGDYNCWFNLRNICSIETATLLIKRQQYVLPSRLQEIFTEDVVFQDVTIHFSAYFSP